ncbi:MAG: hypothetical protein ACI9F9_002473 [Candidatus Paceibacteria bacterium]|jgi:hypothetical protein
MTATPRGFRLEFTAPVDPLSARETASYELSSYTYLLHSPYGSPEVDTETLELIEVVLAKDRLSVELVVSGLREGYVHELHALGVRSEKGVPLLHEAAYYTLVHVPE